MRWPPQHNPQEVKQGIDPEDGTGDSKVRAHPRLPRHVMRQNPGGPFNGPASAAETS
jgi:hypothetical protein